MMTVQKIIIYLGYKSFVGGVFRYLPSFLEKTNIYFIMMAFGFKKNYPGNCL